MKKGILGLIITTISFLAIKNFLVWFVPVSYYAVITVIAILKFKRLGKKDE